MQPLESMPILSARQVLGWLGTLCNYVTVVPGREAEPCDAEMIRTSQKIEAEVVVSRVSQTHSVDINRRSATGGETVPLPAPWPLGLWR